MLKGELAKCVTLSLQVQGATFRKTGAARTLVEEGRAFNKEVLFVANVLWDSQAGTARRLSTLVLQTRVTMEVVLLMEHTFDAFARKVSRDNIVRRKFKRFYVHKVNVSLSQ